MDAPHTAHRAPFFWDNYRFTTMGRYLGRHENAFIQRSLASQERPGLILEIACGSGRLSLPLYADGLEIVGLDIDPVALAALRRQSASMPLVLGDAEWLPFATGRFGACMAIQAFASFEYGRFPAECRRLLSDGGLVIFQSLNRCSYKGLLARAARCVASVGILRRLSDTYPRLAGLLDRVRRAQDRRLAYGESTRDTIRALHNHGFDIVEARGMNWLPFSRLSNRPLVRAAAWLEKVLRLDRLPRISPWVLLAARKRAWP